MPATSRAANHRRYRLSQTCTERAFAPWNRPTGGRRAPSPRRSLHGRASPTAPGGGPAASRAGGRDPLAAVPPEPARAALVVGHGPPASAGRAFPRTRVDRRDSARSVLRAPPTRHPHIGVFAPTDPHTRREPDRQEHPGDTAAEHAPNVRRSRGRARHAVDEPWRENTAAPEPVPGRGLPCQRRCARPHLATHRGQNGHLASGWQRTYSTPTLS